MLSTLLRYRSFFSVSSSDRIQFNISPKFGRCISLYYMHSDLQLLLPLRHVDFLHGYDIMLRWSDVILCEPQYWVYCLGIRHSHIHWIINTTPRLNCYCFLFFNSYVKSVVVEYYPMFVLFHNRSALWLRQIALLQCKEMRLSRVNGITCPWWSMMIGEMLPQYFIHSDVCCETLTTL